MLNYYIQFKVLLRSKKGQGMVEYGLILALIAVVVMVALTPLGGKVASMFNNISAKF
jgi:pilus assembly protein Flp/PilA